MSGHVFIATHGSLQRRIRVQDDGEGKYTIELNGATHQVDARRFGGGNWSLIIDNQSYDVELEVATQSESDGAYNALVRGRVVRLVARDERHERMMTTSKRFTVEGPQTLLSPMPGRIVKLLVEVGEEVADGQPLVVVEAMKMQNELRSPKAGKVSAIMVSEGQGVESGTKLVAVE